MNSEKNILLVGHDRGGVNLLVPLLTHWREMPCGINATFLSTPAIQHEVASMARAAFGATIETPLPAAATAQPMHGSGEMFLGRNAWTFSNDQLGAVLDSKPWDLVLTGTSAISKMEKTAWAMARDRGIPSAVMCDMWTEYRRRLTDEKGNLCLDHLLVLDARMAEEVDAEFGGAVKTTIVGSPHFAHLIGRGRAGETGRENIRFISEPIAALFPSAGIHEFSIAEMMISAMQQSACDAPLILRPHPQDDSEGWRRFAYDFRDCGVRLDDEPSWACALSTRMAIGISSMMLIEFAMAGIPVASIQPPGADESYFCLHESDFGISIVRNVDELAAWLSAPPPPAIDPDFAAQHVRSIDVITQHIKAGTLFESAVTGART